VRVVVDFSGGTLAIGAADATDALPADGTARVEVRQAGISALAIDRSAAGVRVRASQATGRVVFGLESARRAFKYLRVSGLHSPERLVLDLYSSKPPTRAAEIRSGRNGCLTLTSVSADGHGFRVRGVERDLFEASFVMRVRDAAGRVVGRRIMTARGAWNARIAYRVSAAGTGTLEAVASSAKDGSLACLVQVRVGLNP
jgi:immunoglobulin-like protein involved in spore germination